MGQIGGTTPVPPRRAIATLALCLLAACGRHHPCRHYVTDERALWVATLECVRATGPGPNDDADDAVRTCRDVARPHVSKWVADLKDQNCFADGSRQW